MTEKSEAAVTDQSADADTEAVRAELERETKEALERLERAKDTEREAQRDRRRLELEAALRPALEDLRCHDTAIALRCMRAEFDPVIEEGKDVVVFQGNEYALSEAEALRDFVEEFARVHPALFRSPAEHRSREKSGEGAPPDPYSEISERLAEI